MFCAGRRPLAEKAPLGAIYNAGDETSFTVHEMAEAASHGAGRNGAVVSWPLEEARPALGPFADALAWNLAASRSIISAARSLT